MLDTNIRNTTTAWGTALRALALAVLLPPVLGGCIASYHTRHEEPVQPAPDAALVCRYNWTVAEPMFRSENLISFQWAPAPHFGHQVAGGVQTLTAGCPPIADGRIDGQVSAYYLRHVNKVSRGVGALPMAYLIGLSAGFMPMPMTDHFAVCLEITASDGLRRTAIANGQLETLANVWGTSNHRQNNGKYKHTQQLDRVMREVTDHAWRKAWLPGQRDSDKTVSCMKELDAIAKGSKVHSATIVDSGQHDGGVSEPSLTAPTTVHTTAGKW